MKKTMKYPYTTLLGCVFALLALVACGEDGTITAEMEAPIYDVTDSETDAVQHRKAQLYNAYRTYLITNPIVRDYEFNFQKKNHLAMSAPQQTVQVLQAGINRLDEVFLNVYTEDFKKQYMPFSLILADKIEFTAQEEGRPSYHAYCTQRYLAMAGVRAGMENDSDSLKNEIKGDVNSRFWIDYMEAVRKVIAIPTEFSDVSRDYFRKNVEEIKELGDVMDKLPGQIDYHTLGFIGYNRRTTFFDEKEQLWWIETPDEDTDKRQWVAFFFSTPKAERNELFAKYPLMEQKRQILRQAFLQCDGFDIDLLP